MTKDREKIKERNAMRNTAAINGTTSSTFLANSVVSDFCEYKLFPTPAEAAGKKPKMKGSYQCFTIVCNGYTASGTLHGAKRIEGAYKDIFAAIASAEKQIEVYGRGSRNSSNAKIYWYTEDGAEYLAAIVCRNVSRHYYEVTKEK